MYRLEKVLHPRVFYTVLDSLYFPELSWIAATDNQKVRMQNFSFT